MTSTPKEPSDSGDDSAWNDIIARLDGEVFSDVPDIISTGHSHPSLAQESSTDDAELHDEGSRDPDAFIPPDPPPVRVSRNTKIGWGCIAGGPIIYAGAETAGLLDDAVQVLSFGLLIGGAFMLLRNLSSTQPEDEDSAPV